jgi:hypothetical protein
VDPGDQPPPVQEKVEEPEMVHGETESEEREKEHERLEEEFQFFLQRTDPRLAYSR